MADTDTGRVFRRTLPLFDDDDRDVIQRLLHHAVADFRYDHPDRKVARDIYHDIYEGKAVRLHIGYDVERVTLRITPADVDSSSDVIIQRFVAEMTDCSGEWERIARDLRRWHEETGLEEEDVQVGIEYLY